MNLQINIMLLFIACAALPKCIAAEPFIAANAAIIPLGGNAYVTKPDPESSERIRELGITQWTSDKAVISIWLRTATTGNATLHLKYHAQSHSSIKVSCGSHSFNVNLLPQDTIALIGTITIRDTGYIRLDLQGISRTGSEYAQVSALLVEGLTKERLNYVADFSYYWGRRGPSVHLNYKMPDDDTIEYFYNEVKVPLGEDPTGSYYMSNGFAEGYFGMQANSATERRILFSVWSPYNTDRPQDIPDDQKIILLAKGENVRTGEFGNEGAGGQSYLVYPWKTGETYRFLTRIYPNKTGSTIYSAWFFAPEIGEWTLIARFQRPKTDTYYKRAHSFLESFMPENGYRSRKAYYANQWCRTLDGRWLELSSARFTCDDTGRRLVRLDYKGGAENGAFYLQNCGFLNDYIDYGTSFMRRPSGKAPDIDFSKLK